MAHNISVVKETINYSAWNTFTSANTITGSGFGTKPTANSFFNDFESEVVGNVSGDIAGLNVSNAGGLSISNTGAHSGSNVMRQDYTLADFPKIYKELSGTNQNCYMACWFRWSGTVSGSTVWKFGRIGANATYSGVPHAGEAWVSTDLNRPAGFGGEIVTTGGITSYALQATLADPAVVYQPDQWHFYELEFHAGTVDNSDSHFIVRVDGQDTVVWTNRPYLTSTDGLLPTWLLTPLNGLDQGPDVVMLMDSIYVDETRARVVMTDSATYGSSTKWAVQPIETYSDTEVTFTKKRQSFNIGETAYLHLFDDTGTLVSTSDSFTVTAD